MKWGKRRRNLAATVPWLALDGFLAGAPMIRKGRGIAKPHMAIAWFCLGLQTS
jgi:hypothetical protein